MKKIIKMSAVALAISMSLTACDDSDDDGEQPSTPSNTAASFSGDTTGSISTADATISGALTITDPDEGEAVLVAQTDVAQDYGTFSIAADGSWSYTLDGNNTNVAALAQAADELVDNISFTSEDGTSGTIVVTISGVDQLVAKLLDDTSGDASELRYYLETPSTVGRVSFDFYYDASETEKFYFNLYDDSFSSSSRFAEIQLDEGGLTLRDSSLDEDGAFTPDTWVNVQLSWDTTGTNDEVTVYLDGVNKGTYVTEDSIAGNEAAAILFKHSTTDGTSLYPVYIDNLEVFSDAAGTTSVFSDDFQNYSSGDLLDDSNTNAPYQYSTNYNATVALFGADSVTTPPVTGSGNEFVYESTASDVAVGTTGNKVAEITDTDPGDAGELRIKLDSNNLIETGKLTVSFKKSDDTSCSVDATTVKDAYIGIFGYGTSSYDAMVDLRISGSDYTSDYALRNKNETGNKTIELSANPTFTADTWTDVEITWDASSADTTTGPLLSLDIDGVTAHADWNSYTDSLSDVVDGAQLFVFKLGDNSANIPNCLYEVDNIKIYSTAGSVDTLIFAENFEDFNDTADLSIENVTIDGVDTVLFNSGTTAVVGLED